MKREGDSNYMCSEKVKMLNDGLFFVKNSSLSVNLTQFT